MVEKNKYFIKFISVFLSLLLIYIPVVANAGQQDPDDNLTTNGRIVVMGKGERTPFEGLLFDIRAATKLKLDAEFSQKKFQLELGLQKKIIFTEFQLKLGNLQAKYDALQGKHNSLLKIKNEEINRLQDLVKKNPNDYNHWWFAGGLIVGTLISIGIFFAAAEAGK